MAIDKIFRPFGAFPLLYGFQFIKWGMPMVPIGYTIGKISD